MLKLNGTNKHTGQIQYASNHLIQEQEYLSLNYEYTFQKCHANCYLSTVTVSSGEGFITKNKVSNSLLAKITCLNRTRRVNFES